MRINATKPSALFKLTSVSALAIATAMSLSSQASAQLQTSEIINNEDGVDEVIVTVERRSQSLQDYAGTAAAISGEDLKLLGINDFQEIDGKIPGLSIANNVGNVEVYIRGVGSSNNTELGDPAAAFHFNDVYIPRPSGLGAAFFDIERVEVNIGPQGTLRGRNATAGSINAIPWKPGLGIFDAAGEIGYGNYDELTLEGMVNVPVGENSALRIAAHHLEHDSYMENVTPCSNELGLAIPTCEEEGVGVAEAANNFGARATFLTNPTDALTITLTADYNDNKGTGYTGTNYASPLGNGVLPEDIDDPRKVFGRALTWSLGGFYFKEDQRTFLGTTGDRNPFFTGVEFNQFTDTESYSFYGDATYDVTDKMRVTGGLRYTDDHKERFGVNARYGQTFIIGGDGFGCCFATGVGTEGFAFSGFDRNIFNPDTNNDSLLSPQEIIDFYFDGVETFGARDGLDDIYANGQVVDPIPFGDRPICPELLIGFDGTSNGSCFSQATADAFGADTFNPLVGRVSFAVVVPELTSITVQNGALDNDFIDGRMRLEYDVTDDNLLYGLIATGRKSGGFNDNIGELASGDIEINPAGGAPAEFETDSLAPTYDPEKLTLYEFGSKNAFDLDNGSGHFNVSAFYYDYKDKQETSLLSVAQVANFINLPEPPNGGGNIVAFTFNASDAEIYGAQFEGGLQLPGDINLDATLLWLEQARIVESQDVQDSRFQADVDPENAVNRSIEGNRLIRTPKWQFNSSISKAMTLDSGSVDGVLSVGYRSSQFMTLFNGIDYSNPNNPELRLNDKVDGYWTFDAGMGYSHGDDGKWRLEGYISNITNQQKEQAFSRPRTYGARLRVRL